MSEPMRSSKTAAAPHVEANEASQSPSDTSTAHAITPVGELPPQIREALVKASKDPLAKNKMLCEFIIGKAAATDGFLKAVADEFEKIWPELKAAGYIDGHKLARIYHCIQASGIFIPVELARWYICDFSLYWQAGKEDVLSDEAAASLGRKIMDGICFIIGSPHRPGQDPKWRSSFIANLEDTIEVLQYVADGTGNMVDNITHGRGRYSCHTNMEAILAKFANISDLDGLEKASKELHNDLIEAVESDLDPIFKRIEAALAKLDAQSMGQ